MQWKLLHPFFGWNGPERLCNQPFFNENSGFQFFSYFPFSITSHQLFTHFYIAGAFAYIEASFPRVENDTARLLSKVLSGSKCMTFHYHMYSADPTNIGTLNVYMKSKNFGTMVKIFSASGSQGNEWKQKNLNLIQSRKNTRYQVRTVFRSI